MKQSKTLISPDSLDLSLLQSTRCLNNRMILSEAARRNLLSLGRKFNRYLHNSRRKITADTVRAFLEDLKSEYAPSTWNLTRQNLKRLLKLQPDVRENYLWRLLIDEIFKDIRPVKLDRQVREYLHEQEINQLINQSSPKLSLLIETMFVTGCRISELTGIRWRDIRTSKHEAVITVLGKGNKIRTVYISQSLLTRIKNEFNSKVYLFENRNQHRLDASNLWKKIKKSGYDVLQREIHPHLIRHSTANYLLKKKGKSAKYVSKYLGHSTPAVTLDMYVHDQPGAEILNLFNLISRK